MYCVFFRINNLGQSVKIVLLTKDKDLERLRQIVNFVLNDEMKTLQLAGMLRAAGNQIDPRGFQRAVA